MKTKQNLLFGIAITVMAAALAFTGCPEDPTSNGGFVAVTDINAGISDYKLVDADQNLNQNLNQYWSYPMVEPRDATNQTIAWSIKSAGTTNATLTGSILKTTAVGTVVVTATIANGKGAGTPFTKDFTITVIPSKYTIQTYDDWVSALATVQAVGSGSEGFFNSYEFTITGNVGVPGTEDDYMFSGRYISITLLGNGTLYLDDSEQEGQGSIFRLNDTQTLVIGSATDAPHLVGLTKGVTDKGGTYTPTRDNNDSLVYIVVHGYTSTLKLVNGTISGNSIVSSDNSMGGGVHIAGGSFTMSGGEISGNSVSTSSRRYSTSSGGGVYVFGGSFTMSGGKISGNNASSSSFDGTGGGVFVRNHSSFTMSGGEISGNSVSNGAGGGVYVGYDSSFTMSGGKISGNSASGGGGVYVSDNNSFYNAGSSFTMSGGEISGNSASGGGGVYVYNAGGDNKTDSFTKTGGTIYGYNSGDSTNSLWNKVITGTPATITDTWGHAVFYNKDDGYYHDTTLNTTDNISIYKLPTQAGAANSGTTNWIKK